jgi:hypothetical protein
VLAEKLIRGEKLWPKDLDWCRATLPHYRVQLRELVEERWAKAHPKP